MLGYAAWKSARTSSRIGASTAPALQPWRVRSPVTLAGSKAGALLWATLSAGGARVGCRAHGRRRPVGAGAAAGRGQQCREAQDGQGSAHASLLRRFAVAGGIVRITAVWPGTTPRQCQHGRRGTCRSDSQGHSTRCRPASHRACEGIARARREDHGSRVRLRLGGCTRLVPAARLVDSAQLSSMHGVTGTPRCAPRMLIHAPGDCCREAVRTRTTRRMYGNHRRRGVRERGDATGREPALSRLPPTRWLHGRPAWRRGRSARRQAGSSASIR